jgi:hypothetical protein
VAISWIQGGHQLAKKVINNDFPAKILLSTFLPLTTSSSLKAGIFVAAVAGTTAKQPATRNQSDTAAA